MRTWKAFVIVVAFIAASECRANQPVPQAGRRPIMSPYLYLDPTFSCPYWRWMQPSEPERNGHGIPKHIPGIVRPPEVATPPGGIRPTGHRTHFMFVPVGPQ